MHEITYGVGGWVGVYMCVCARARAQNSTCDFVVPYRCIVLRAHHRTVLLPKCSPSVSCPYLTRSLELQNKNIQIA